MRNMKSRLRKKEREKFVVGLYYLPSQIKNCNNYLIFTLWFALSAAVGLAWLLMNALMLEIFAFGMFQVLHCSWLYLNFTFPISFFFTAFPVL